MAGRWHHCCSTPGGTGGQHEGIKQVSHQFPNFHILGTSRFLIYVALVAFLP